MKGFSAESSRQSGFTLIEVLLASVVMVVGIVGILAVFPHAYRTTKTAGRLSVLNHLAVQKTEYLRSINYNGAELSAGIHPALQTDSSGAKYYPVPGFGEEYSLRWRVLNGPTDKNGNPEPDMKTIVVEVTHLVRYTILEVPIKVPQSLEVVFRTYITD